MNETNTKQHIAATIWEPDLVSRNVKHEAQKQTQQRIRCQSVIPG